MRLFVICLLCSCVLTCVAQDPCRVDYRKADSIAATLRGQSLIDRRELTRLLTQSLPTPEEKFRAIYRWIADNIKYDLATGTKNLRLRQKLKDPAKLLAWQREAALLTWRNLINERKTVCTGYAYLLREMAGLAGVECLVVDGYSRNSTSNIGGDGFVNHSWNAVKLSGSWYLCDPTWSAGYFVNGGGRFVQRFEPAYFLTKPEVFVLNHFPVDASWTLLDESHRPSKTEFLNAPLVYGAAIRKEVFPSSKNFRVESKPGEDVSFDVANLGPTSVVVMTASQSGKAEVKVDCLQTKSGANVNRLTCAAPARGTYGMHVQVDGDYVMTFELVVR